MGYSGWQEESKFKAAMTAKSALHVAIDVSKVNLECQVCSTGKERDENQPERLAHPKFGHQEACGYFVYLFNEGGREAVSLNKHSGVYDLVCWFPISILPE